MEGGAGSYFIELVEEYSFQKNPYLVPGGLRGSTWAPLRVPRQELADVQVANGLDEKRGPRTEIAAVERREARRSWTGDLRRNGDRPDREAGHEVRRSAPAPSRRSAPLALRGKVPQTSGAPASREYGGLFEIRIRQFVGCAKACPREGG